jgi:hypothetical protein
MLAGTTACAPTGRKARRDTRAKARREAPTSLNPLCRSWKSLHCGQREIDLACLYFCACRPAAERERESSRRSLSARRRQVLAAAGASLEPFQRTGKLSPALDVNLWGIRQAVGVLILELKTRPGG